MTAFHKDAAKVCIPLQEFAVAAHRSAFTASL